MDADAERASYELLISLFMEIWGEFGEGLLTLGDVAYLHVPQSFKPHWGG